jgi:hypothetical protein
LEIPHRATFTTQGKVKNSYPDAAIRRLWHILLLNQFHDILPGSSIHTVYETAHRQLAEALLECSDLRDTALHSGEGNRKPDRLADLEGLIWNFQLDDRPLLAEIAVEVPEGESGTTSCTL